MPIAFVMTAIAGCDLTGQYDKKFQESLQKAAKNAVYQTNLYEQYTDAQAYEDHKNTP